MMLPKVLKFLISFQGPVVPLISINEYFDLTLMVLLGAGVIFELPVLIFFYDVVWHCDAKIFVGELEVCDS